VLGPARVRGRGLRLCTGQGECAVEAAAVLGPAGVRGRDLRRCSGRRECAAAACGR